MGSKTTVGIDLGTTNTVLAANAEPLGFTIEGGPSFVMPSAVAYPPNGETIVGRAARTRRAIDPMNTLVSAKRVIGVRWGSVDAQRFMDMYPYRCVDKDGDVAFDTRAGVRTPVDVGRTVVQTLAKRTDAPTTGVRAVVSVPVAFSPDRRTATLRAATGLGFDEVAVIEEPVATAMAYLSRSALQHAMVYDLGGGTFDAAIVNCERYPFTVIGHSGDPYLGGDDVDRWIAERVAKRALERSGWDLADNPETFGKLLFHCENAKIALSERDEVQIVISDVDPAAPSQIDPETITQEEVQGLTLDLVRRSFVMCDDALSQAGLVARDVDAVFLAGGSTSLPGLRDFVEQYFSKKPRFDLDPMHVVAIGASLAAARPGVSELLDFVN